MTSKKMETEVWMIVPDLSRRRALQKMQPCLLRVIVLALSRALRKTQPCLLRRAHLAHLLLAEEFANVRALAP